MKRKLLSPKMSPRGSVKIIGLGGVGSIVARYGAVFLASLGKNCVITLIDGDKFENKNASRMLFGSYGYKSSVVRRELIPRFRDSKLAITESREYVTPENIDGLIQKGDIVLLCVDNHKTRKLVNDHCKTLRNICLISGGNDGVGKDSSGRKRRGTYGNIQIYQRAAGKDITPPLDKFHPEIANPKDKAPNELNCTDLVVSTPQILFSNLQVASAMLNTLILFMSGQTYYGELSFDIAEALMRPTIKV